MNVTTFLDLSNGSFQPVSPPVNSNIISTCASDIRIVLRDDSEEYLISLDSHPWCKLVFYNVRIVLVCSRARRTHEEVYPEILHTLSKIWNQLPVDLRDPSLSLHQFTKNLKSVLFPRVYYVWLMRICGGLVEIPPHSSPSSPLTCGVPQGSVLGPVLFKLYTTPLSSLISASSISHLLYADDTKLFISSYLLFLNICRLP